MPPSLEKQAQTLSVLKRAHEMRERGACWGEIADAFGVRKETIRGQYSRWRREQAAEAPAHRQSTAPESSRIVEIVPRPEQGIPRIQTLDDLLAVLEVDPDEWSVKRFKGNAWEQHSTDRGLVTLLQVKADFERPLGWQAALLREIADDLLADMRAHAPAVYEHIPRRRTLTPGDDPVLLEIDIMDPHFGLLAWGREVGEKYDLDIAVQDYLRAVQHLLSLAQFYPVERILFVAGNDMLHVDGPAPASGGKGGATAAGTVQDVDSRLAKQFTAARRALVAAIDQARLVAPVDVLFVAGNHDAQQTYRMGEVIAAWYRNDPEVNVIYGPQKRHFYGYGRNTFMLTHGEEFQRQRDGLPLIFATECPAELWVGSEGGCREVHTGHNHRRLTGKYTPTSEVSESRAIVTRSLPGLTATDSWHYEQGYKHRRAATALAFRRSGGIAGLHEFNP